MAAETGHGAGGDERLVVFVKAPRPGQVKTRLATTLGAAAAATAYRALTERVLANVRELPGVELRFAPDDALAEIQPWLQPGRHARPQGEGDLGTRLERAFAEAFADGARRVVLIGSDCPAVTASDIRAAWHTLDDADLVLGPALDGGYWLIGLSQPQPALFHEIPWSTDAVFAFTRQRARELRLRTALLRELADVDTLEDWMAFQASLAQGGC
jgi:hypothetical protein